MVKGLEGLNEFLDFQQLSGCGAYKPPGSSNKPCLREKYFSHSILPTLDLEHPEPSLVSKFEYLGFPIIRQ